MLAVKLHNGTLLPARKIHMSESSQWNLEASGGGHHVVATDRIGVEHYVVKSDILTMDQADELACVIENAASSDDATLEYLIEEVNKNVYNDWILNYFVKLDAFCFFKDEDSDRGGGGIDPAAVNDNVTKQYAHWVPCSETGGFYTYDK